MDFPSDVKYTKDHEWIREDDGTYTVGITDFAQSELGDVVFVDITAEGEEVDAGEVFGSIEAVKTVSDLYMPISGEVVEVNRDLETEPELVNSDPFGSGWLVKIKASNPDEISELLASDAYQELTGN
jgi:glycine cleavage system H protein